LHWGFCLFVIPIDSTGFFFLVFADVVVVFRSFTSKRNPIRYFHFNFRTMRYAPLNTPIVKRRETGSIVVWIFLMPMCFTLFLYLLFFSDYYLLALGYLVFLALDTAAESGGRKVNFLRRLPSIQLF
jgi:hypothetical protein